MVWPLLVLEELDGDWLEVDDEGMLDDWLLFEDGDWLLELDDGDVLAEAPWSLDVELEVLEGLLELPMLLEEDDGLALDEVDDGEALEALEPDCPHLLIAAWVLGPMMPSIGPGSHPCDFSCCCCSRTDSLPWALPPMLEPDIPPDALVSLELDEEEGELLLDELDGDCELVADCELFEELEEGWLALDDCDWA